MEIARVNCDLMYQYYCDMGEPVKSQEYLDISSYLVDISSKMKKVINNELDFISYIDD